MARTIFNPRLTLTLQGEEEVLRELERAAREIPDRAAEALEAEAAVELHEMLQRTPRLTGRLRATGRLSPAVRGKVNIFVEIRFGGADAPYAVVQHYRYWYEHTEGEAYYVQSVLDEARRYFARRVAQRLGLVAS
ncbi:MAG TPA: hypothetical protein VNI83_04625 [Vicinamibacterales bacterium]|nr:hypothetical protein [Vicinamibacterales bacterium]